MAHETKAGAADAVSVAHIRSLRMPPSYARESSASESIRRIASARDIWGLSDAAM
jgi:hypothetical protein